MKTLNKYFENLFDIDNSDDILKTLIGTDIGDFYVSDIENKYVVLSSHKNGIYTPYIKFQQDVDKFIEIYKITRKPFVLRHYPLTIMPNEKLYFEGVEFITEYVVLTATTSKLIDGINLTCKNVTVKRLNTNDLFLEHCYIHCINFEIEKYHMMPYTSKSTIDIKNSKDIDEGLNINCMSGDVHFRDFYYSVHNALDKKLPTFEYNMTGYLGLENVNTQKVNIYGDIKITGWMYDRHFVIYRKGTPEYKDSKKIPRFRCGLYDKYKDWFVAWLR